MRTLTIIGLAFSCVACISASPAKVDEHFGPVKSTDIETLIKRWGVPQQQTEVNGKQYAEWTRTDVSSNPSFSIGIGGFGNRVGGGVSTTMGGKDQLDACTVQVEYDTNGVVTDLRWNGETDVCVERFESLN